ncbi:extracellular solute-binding protein [Roseitranquillus sediminis]|uniref:extracellular solute-binding protein n=1 Tax=Roseitranquillus sediminis TaxID=2809051 RepID=UPI001D0C0763|nr:extracellular solute-binding protein [Roseitranquillus sediminis]
MGAIVSLCASPLAAQTDVIVSHGISAFGDLKYPEGFPHFEYVNPDAPRGGTMSFRGVLASRTFDSLNLFILKGEPAQGLELVHDTLLTRSADEPDAAYGLIAESMEYPPDRSWIVFNLRPEARFSDGEPLTSEDVVFTFETLKTQGRPQYRIALADVESARALGPHSVRFDFAPGASTRDLPMVVGDLEILPAHYYAEVPFDTSTLEPPVSSGAYVVSDVSPGRNITYCRSRDYWGEGLAVNVGTHNFDCVRYEYFADSTAAFEALKAGAYLFHEEFSSAIWAQGYDFPAVERGWVIRDELRDERPSGTQGFWLNLRREKMQDPRLREALGLLFNFEWTNATLFHGLYTRTDSFWENTTMQAEGVPEGDELALLDEFRDALPPDVFEAPAHVPPISSTSQQLDRTALREASRLLEEAGWTVGTDGLRRNAQGETLSLEILDDNPSFERVILPYVANLRRVGIDARYELVDPAQMQQRQEDFDYDVTPGRLVLSLTPSASIRSVFGTSGAQAPGSLNLAGVADPVVDALIDRIVASESRAEMETRVRALDRVLRAKHIWVPNWHKGAHWIAYWDVFGRPDIQPPYARGDAYWWFDEDRYEALQAQGALR